jgi:hypothetical protein
MKFLNQQRPDRLAAFRLPATLMQTVDAICKNQDITRSQFFRRCIVEYANRHQLVDSTN